MSLEAVRDSFHAQLLNYRNIDYIINSEDFAIAYDNASKIEKGEIKKVVERADKKTLRKFIKKQLLKLTPWHRMSIKQLREVGKNLRIKEWWNKNKCTLIEEIKDVVERIKKNS